MVAFFCYWATSKGFSLKLGRSELMQTFPLPYVFEIKKKSKYFNTTVTMQSKLKQIQRTAIGILRTWDIVCKGDNDERELLEAFYDEMYGISGKFIFYNENNEAITARFASDEPEYNLIREFSTTEVTHGVVVGFTANLSIESVI